VSGLLGSKSSTPLQTGCNARTAQVRHNMNFKLHRWALSVNVDNYYLLSVFGLATAPLNDDTLNSPIPCTPAAAAAAAAAAAGPQAIDSCTCQ
jgi:hypothetical protein